MIKDILKEKETIAYLSLQNDLKNNHLAHSYLLSGELNPLKKDVAFLLAQSIIEDKNDFACETCNTCKRIKEGKYFDVIYVDGNAKQIVKEDIEYIMSEFSRTSLEGNNKKVYILDNINNSSPKVLNMLLKFMEEPTNEETYGIFITNDIDNLLETIVSRCEKIPFVTRDFSELVNQYKDKGFENVDAYLLSEINHELIDIELDDEAYLNAKEYVYKTIDNLNNLEYIPVLYSREFYTSVPKDNFKKCSDYYLNIMIKMLEDSIENKTIEDDEYNEYLNKLRNSDYKKLLGIFLKASDKSNYPVNRSLLFDSIAYEMMI